MAFAHPKKHIEQLNIAPGMKVADFGAGAGYLAVELADAVGESGKVFVIDIQSDLLTKATHLASERHLQSLVFLQGDLEKPNGSSLESDSLDVVICSNLLFQVAHKDAVVSEAHRVLRPSGRLLIIDWRESFGGIGPQPEHVFNEIRARDVCERLGYSFVSEIDAGTYHYGLIYRK